MRIHRAKRVDELLTHSSCGSLMSAHLRDGELVASNGAAMVIICVPTDPGDVDGPIYPSVFKFARKSTPRGQEDMEILSGEDSIKIPGLTLERPKNKPFIDDPKKLIPLFKEDTLKIKIDASLLLKVSKALGAINNQVILEIGLMVPDSSPIKVTSRRSSLDVGVICQCK